MKAIKVVNKKDFSAEDVAEICNAEISSMRELDHPNVVSLIDYDFEGKKVYPDGREDDIAYMVIDLCDGGELFNLIL